MKFSFCLLIYDSSDQTADRTSPYLNRYACAYNFTFELFFQSISVYAQSIFVHLSNYTPFRNLSATTVKSSFYFCSSSRFHLEIFFFFIQLQCDRTNDTILVIVEHYNNIICKHARVLYTFHYYNIVFFIIISVYIILYIILV